MSTSITPDIEGKFSEFNGANYTLFRFHLWALRAGDAQIAGDYILYGKLLYRMALEVSQNFTEEELNTLIDLVDDAINSRRQLGVEFLRDFFTAESNIRSKMDDRGLLTKKPVNTLNKTASKN